MSRRTFKEKRSLTLYLLLTFLQTSPANTVSTLINWITCNIVISGGCGQVTRGWFFSITCSVLPPYLHCTVVLILLLWCRWAFHCFKDLSMTCGGMKLAEEGQSGERGNPLKSQNIYVSRGWCEGWCEMHAHQVWCGLNSFRCFSPFHLPTKCQSNFSFGRHTTKVKVWPLKDSLNPNSGSQDRTASLKSS